MDLGCLRARDDGRFAPVHQPGYRVFVNTTFWIKMSIMVLAGINMLIFELITVRGVQNWDLEPTPPLPARLAGGISLACWALGRHLRSLDRLHHAAGVIAADRKWAWAGVPARSASGRQGQL